MHQQARTSQDVNLWIIDPDADDASYAASCNYCPVIANGSLGGGSRSAARGRGKPPAPIIVWAWREICAQPDPDRMWIMSLGEEGGGVRARKCLVLVGDREVRRYVEGGYWKPRNGETWRRIPRKRPTTTNTMMTNTKGEVRRGRPWSITITFLTWTALERTQPYSSDMATAARTTDWRLPPQQDPPTATALISYVEMEVREIDEDDTEVGEEEAL